MGLDMYLYVRRWVSSRDEKYSDITSALGFPSEYDKSRFVTVEGTIAYWRKANAIHNWFVNNVQDGVDNCENYNVSKAQLLQLREVCQRSIVNRDNGQPVELETISGFFFGNTEYNEGYWQDLQDTIEQIDVAVRIDKSDEVEYMYHASW